MEDGTAFVPIHAILVGSHVVKAIKNPDPLGRRPYYVTSYERVANSLYGRSIPERMTDCQDGVNGCLRNLLNNLALASGPQVGVDIDALDAGTDVAIYPWKAWQYHGRKVEFSRQPLTFFQPQSNAEQLIGVADYFENKSDDRTLIPRYTHGSEAMGGAAGETASGLSMLLNAAAKGIKNVIAHVDKDVIQPAISSIYTWNLLYLPDDQWAEIKGDCRVVARGALAMLVREQLQARRQEFLDRTANDIDLQIIGVEGRATVLRSIAEDLGYPRDEVVPSKEDLIRRMQAQAMQAARTRRTSRRRPPMLRKPDQEALEALGRIAQGPDWQRVDAWLRHCRQELVEELADGSPEEPGLVRGAARVLREISEMATAAAGLMDGPPRRAGGRFF